MDKNLKKFMDVNSVTKIPEYAKTGIDMANLFLLGLIFRYNDIYIVVNCFPI